MFFHTKVKESRDEFYAKFLHTFFEINADYYVSIGDLTNFGKEDVLREVYEIIRHHDKPFIHTLGNHDLGSLQETSQIDL
ncbi:metallophosphoesterase family protein [Virgibacillus pantothenticus]|uniref:metallophosphoesterase n=1 Tax=Virgibacillus pantothenticus TaxID=1473 RepID=UPI000984F1BA|nr:metallophosphoesterase family protein [Virgibacillus pantothenticus]